MSAIVGVIMGSKSDLEVMQECFAVLSHFGIEYEAKVVSAHRTPLKMVEYAVSAVERGLKVVIAGAGGAAHLPGMVASLTTLPVIGVPIKSKALNGIDSLLSIVQMPYGAAVATVAINQSKNAALLAVQILSISDINLSKAVADFKEAQRKLVEEDSNI